jgi:hypothetical protein
LTKKWFGLFDTWYKILFTDGVTKKWFGLVDTWYKILFTDGVTKREGGVDGRHATGSSGMYNSSTNISQRIFVLSDILVANSSCDGIS